MDKFILILILLLPGCSFSYIGDIELPDHRAGIEKYIEFYETELISVEEELAHSEGDIEHAREYILKNPDTTWNNTGSRLLSRAKHKRDFLLLQKSTYQTRIKNAKRKLNEYEKD